MLLALAVIAIFFVLIPFGIAYSEGRRRRIGFWLSLILSIVLTPVIGYIISNASPLKNAPGCKWCGNSENEAEYCGMCGKNWDGETKPGFIKR